MTDEVLVPAEVAVILRVSESTVRRMVVRGALVRIAGTALLLIPRRSVDRLLEGYDADCGRAWRGDGGEAAERTLPDRGDDGLRDGGVAEDTRMARLGHSTTAMSRRYAKASEAQDRDAAERLGRALSG